MSILIRKASPQTAKFDEEKELVTRVVTEGEMGEFKYVCSNPRCTRKKKMYDSPNKCPACQEVLERFSVKDVLRESRKGDKELFLENKTREKKGTWPDEWGKECLSTAREVTQYKRERR